MMNTKIQSPALVLALFLCAPTASAQGILSAPPPPERSGQHRGYQGALTVGPALWLSVDRSLVRPGADLNLFNGFDMGYVVVGLGLGAMWTPINFYNLTDFPSDQYQRRPITRLYIAPELRFQVPNDSPFVPYFGVTFDANWWRVKVDSVVCGWLYQKCGVFQYTSGTTLKLGFASQVHEWTHLDVGIKYSLSGPGYFFLQGQHWVTPYFGLLFR